MLKRNRIFITGGATSTSSMPAEHLTGAELRVPGTSKAHELVAHQAEANLDEGILSIGDYPRSPQG